MPGAVLFDLDGTLADTARDLGGALNRLLAEEGQAPLPFERLRPHVSGGARALIGAGFGLKTGDTAYPPLQQRFLAHYRAALCAETVLFDGMAALLDDLDRKCVPWGIVTNKAQSFTLEVIEGLGLRNRAGCCVSGDSSPRAKPAVDPMQLACAILGVAPSATVYVGDDPRDVVAGRDAGMTTVAVAYGYLGAGPAIGEWGADHIVANPGEIGTLLQAGRMRFRDDADDRYPGPPR